MSDKKPTERPLLNEKKAVTDLTDKQLKAIKKTFFFDQLLYTGGALNILTSSFILGRFPWFYWVLHIIKAFVYLPWRYVRFSRWKGQLYLVEFCYFVSYFTTIACIYAWCRVNHGFHDPLESYTNLIFKAAFSFSTGTLAISVIIFRNSLVFHDVDQLTSTFIHLSPPITFWSLRWGGGLGQEVIWKYWGAMFQLCKADAETCIDKLWCTSCPASLWDLAFLPMCAYLICWAIPYYIMMFHVLPGWIERNGMDTLFKYMTMKSNGEPKKCWVTDNFPRPWWKVAYMLQHTLLTIVCTFISYLMWHCYWLHTTFLFGLVAVSVYNGATYTFQVLAIRYANDQLKKHGDRLGINEAVADPDEYYHGYYDDINQYGLTTPQDHP